MRSLSLRSIIHHSYQPQQQQHQDKEIKNAV